MLSIKVADFPVTLAGRVIWGTKLLDKKFSENWFTPLFYVYLMMLRLKSPEMTDGLFSIVSSSRRVFIKSLLNLWCFIVGCLYITPTRWFLLLEITNSLNTDSSSLHSSYIWRSFQGLYERLWEIYIKAPPAEDSAGVSSML